VSGPGDEESGRRLLLHMSVSMDGFVANREKQIDWMAPRGEGTTDHGDQRHRINLELITQIGTIVMGSGAYGEFFRGWGDSSSPMADYMNGLPKLVFSGSLDSVEWNNATLAERPLAEEITALKRQPGKDMVVFGGGRIARSLLRERLFDELRLTVHPVILGDGLSLMQGLPEPQRFELISSTVYTDGTIGNVLRPAA
jgi:dihydrofolate reductase